MDQLVPLSTDDACQYETDDRVLETRSNAANRYAMHDRGNPKDTSPFLKSNYKYKRRVRRQILPPEGGTQVIPSSDSNKSLVTEPEQLKMKHSRHLRPPLIDSYFERVAVGFIASAVILFRDILLNSLKRVAREWRVWCINSNKIHQRLSQMSGEVKKFATDGSRWRRYAATAAIQWSKSSGLECFSTSLKLIYLTLFIALWMTAYEVEAGTCWMERADNGKCKNIFSSNMTKTECCRANQMHSYSEEDLSNVEHFFVLALGGGKGCSPCFENCKDVVCGPNKRCVKRKGRPKCICSPQCGSGKKHNKKAHKRKQQHQQQTQHQQNGSLKSPHVIDVSRSKEHVSLVNFHSPITVRDVRSLSSEIHSNPSAVSAMILTSPGDDIISQSNSRRKNQRIPTNPTKKQVNQPLAHQHRPNHQSHHHQGNQNKKHHKHQQQQEEHEQEKLQQQQQRPPTTMARRRHANTDRNKGDKIIITADDRIRPSTERDSDLPESNSLGASVNRAPGTSADTHQAHQQPHGQHGRHHMKKHAKPKRKIADHNSVYNGTATMMTTTGISMAVSEGSRGKMKQTERRLQRPQSFDVALPTSFASAAPDQQRAKKQKPSLMLQPSVGSSSSSSSGGSANNRELHLGQDYVDDLTFDDKIHNEFFSNGFPYAHQELSPDEDRYNHPVCGSDGRTYNTECQLKKRACRTDNHALVVAYRGHCQTSCKEVNCLNGLQCVEDHYAIPHCIVCSIQCPFDDAAGPRIDPARAVCGVDGNTYKSTCDINRMVCKIGRSIAVAYQGPCREDRASCSNVNCGPRMTCLRDLRTHQPRCVTCRFKCPRKRRPSNSRYEEGKLCGSNNRTYHSWCEMKKDSCSTGFYIDFKSIGNCKSG